MPARSWLDSVKRGSAAQKVIVGSYGKGKATIDTGDGRGLTLEGCDYVQIRDLKFMGSGRKTGNRECGLYLAHAAGVEVENVEVTGFRGAGVNFAGLNDSGITRVYAHENGFAGINSDGDLSRNIRVAHCLAENNPGDPTIKEYHSGNGIVLGKVQDAVIEYCEARYNGWDMPRERERARGHLDLGIGPRDHSVLRFSPQPQQRD